MDLKEIKYLLGKIPDFTVSNVTEDEECKEYCGYSVESNNLRVKFRKAKVTPKKTGQFVTLWKRNANKQTEPFDILDDFDFYMILVAQDDKLGYFLFPKDTLGERQILTVANKPGKRGFRVYPIWDTANSAQAKKTKNWQIAYFTLLQK